MDMTPLSIVNERALDILNRSSMAGILPMLNASSFPLRTTEGEATAILPSRRFFFDGPFQRISITMLFGVSSAS